MIERVCRDMKTVKIYIVCVERGIACVCVEKRRDRVCVRRERERVCVYV